MKKKNIIAGTDEVETTTSADSIAAPATDQLPAAPDQNVSLTEHTKDLAAKAMIYIEQYGMLAGAIALGTAAAIVIARKIMDRRKK